MGTSDTKALNYARETLDELHCSAAELKKARETLVWLRDNSTDHRVRLAAAKDLRDMALAALQYEEPAKQKHEHEHHFPEAIQIEIVRPKDEKEGTQA